MRATAINPATKTVATSTVISREGPRNAPRAPTSFQSPAPRLLSRTKGKSSPNPSPAPNSELLAPAQPEASVFAAKPRNSARTVSQLGIRRERQWGPPPAGEGKHRPRMRIMRGYPTQVNLKNWVAPASRGLSRGHPALAVGERERAGG